MKYGTLDAFWMNPLESQCWSCKLLIDGCCDMTCHKHPDGFAPDLWNNKVKCPDRQGLDDVTPKEKKGIYHVPRQQRIQD